MLQKWQLKSYILSVELHLCCDRLKIIEHVIKIRKMFHLGFWDKDLNVKSNQKPQDLNNIRSHIMGLPAVLVLSANNKCHVFGKIRYSCLHYQFSGMPG